jgi:hypothetical protein
MISDDHHLDEARSPGLGDGRVDVLKNQVGNQADQDRRGCWVQMCVVLALVEIDGEWCLWVSLDGLKVDWRSVGQMDQDIGAGSVQYPCLSADVIAKKEKLT